MKKLFVLAIFLVVIGILCAVFFIHPNSQKEDTDERPWTVGDQVMETETVTETTAKEELDAVSAFSDFVDLELRERVDFLNEGENFAPQQLQNAVYGLYIYDVDTDGTEELAVVRAGKDGIYLDMYEFSGSAVQLSDSILLVLDEPSGLAFGTDLSSMDHIAARMTIYPSGTDRYLCLTVEQQGKYSDYNAYTVVYEYAKGKLSEKQCFRLRRIGDTLTLMRMGDAALLYRLSGDTSDEDISLAKYSDLNTAFKTEFQTYGLSAPEIKIENGTLTQYKVTAVQSEQHVFEFTTENGAIRIIENGFLQSFLIRH